MIFTATKKPITVEACIFDEASVEKINELKIFMGIPTVNMNPEDEKKMVDEYVKNGMAIRTLEGITLLSFGDVLLKGVNGEFYPCKRDIFDKSYDYEK